MLEKSRIEAILQSIIDNTPTDVVPESRVEVLLLKLKTAIETGGSGGDVSEILERLGTVEQDISLLADEVGDILPQIPEPTDELPNPIGEAAVGVSEEYARADHVHSIGDVDLSNYVKKISLGSRTVVAYRTLAKLPKNDEGEDVSVTFLASDFAPYQTMINGLWAVQVGVRKSVISVSVEELISPEGSGVTFGYWSDDTNMYFGVKTPADNGESNIYVLKDYTNAFSVTEASTYEPSGWVSVEPNKSVKMAEIPSVIEDNKIITEDDIVVLTRDEYRALQEKTALFYYVKEEPLTLEQRNGYYEDRNITDVYSIDELAEMIKAGNAEDVVLGNYFTVKNLATMLPDPEGETDDPTIEVTEDVDLMIAGFNYYYNTGDTAFTDNHIVLIPRNAGFKTTEKMNKTNSADNGYLNSYMHKTVLPCYAASLKTALKNHLLSHRELLTNKVTTTSEWEWDTVELCLMNEVQVYGTTVFSSSGYDVGNACGQLPVFRFVNPVQFGRNYFWLRSVVGSTVFAYCSFTGSAACAGASNAYYVRPLILFG